MVSRVGSAVTGGAAGAAAGAPFGPWGAAGGGLIGAIGGLASPGNKDKVRQLPTLSKEQRGYQGSLIDRFKSQGLGQNYDTSQDFFRNMLSNDPGAFNQFSSPYLQQFEQQILPRLAERFGAMGGGEGGGLAGSSGFGQAIGGAGAQLSSNLAQQWNQMRQNAASQLGQNALGRYGIESNLAFQRPFENVYQPGTPGFGANALTGVAQGYGQGAGQRAGYNMMNGWNSASNSIGNQSIQDTYAPNGGFNSTYNPYTGNMGY